jgi:hypothetical protein
MAGDSITLEGHCAGKFGKAFKFQANEWEDYEFLPASQCTLLPEPHRGPGMCSMEIPMWLANKNGWA